MFVYNSFIDSFNLFGKLTISMIRFLKINIKHHRGYFKNMKGSVIDEIFFITNGKLTL